MTELLCPACDAPKTSTAVLCRSCLDGIAWPIRSALRTAERNLRKHPSEAGARARYRAAAAAAIRAASSREPSPPPLAPAS